jgi:hypothetical protein
VPNVAPVRFPPAFPPPKPRVNAASVYLGFTRDMHCMFNGAPVVTHEPGPFVEVLDRGRFFEQLFGHRNAMKC